VSPVVFVFPARASIAQPVSSCVEMDVHASLAILHGTSNHFSAAAAVVCERNDSKTAHEELHGKDINLRRSEEEKVALRREHQTMERDLERHRLDLEQSQAEAAQLAAEVRVVVLRRTTTSYHTFPAICADNSALSLALSNRTGVDRPTRWKRSTVHTDAS
jgi:hypothetical protein